MFMQALFDVLGIGGEREFSFSARQNVTEDLTYADDEAIKIFEQRTNNAQNASLFRKIA
jgi:hypothetical protein